MFFARKAALVFPEWKDAFKFAFVRNPWDRVVSLYHHQTQKNPTPFRHWIYDIVIRDGYPLYRKETWLPTDNTSSTGGTSQKWKSQTDWLIDDDGSVCVDFIGRYENLQEDFDKACKVIGIKTPKLPHANRSESKAQYHSYYQDEDLIKIVADWHKKDIERFGYKFDLIRFI